MSRVLTLVRGEVDESAVDRMTDQYRAGLSHDRPPGLEATWLLRGSGATVGVATLWRDRAALDAMRASGEEPFARRLIREAGGSPEVEIFDVIESSAG
ncbi:MAG TPA: hypothetical protein VGK63_01140 [Candidatus Limnocylindrales bacterium]